MIQLQGVSKSYGILEAVSDISFSVQEGETLGFLGPNGAGKTTTMRMIAGYLPPSSGEIMVDGKNIMESSVRIRKKIGYLPETAPLYSFFTVDEYLNFVADLKLVKRSKIKSRVEYAMTRCGLVGVKNRLVSHLSKGYKQRVGIAQAIIHNPKILILDEPTVGLDPRQIIEVREMIQELKNNHTIILSSHILPEISMSCDRVIIINNGKIAAEDTTENIETKLQASRHVYLETKDKLSDENMQEFLKIGAVNLVNNEGRGILLSVEKNSDIRSEAAELVVEKGWGLLELVLRKPSLEEVFISVVSEEQNNEEGELA